jgi:hypothetical protein
MSAHTPMPQGPGATDAPALGFSMQVDLGAGRVCTLQTFLPNDCTVEHLNHMLDKMTAAGDRQRAHYKIEELEREIEQHEREQAQHQEDLDRLDREYEARQEQRNAEVEKAQLALDNLNAAARDAHVATGKRGEFALRGTDKSRHDAVSSGVQALVLEMAKDEAEHDVAHANSTKTFERRGQIIERTRAEIARCKAIVGER